MHPAGLLGVWLSGIGEAGGMAIASQALCPCSSDWWCASWPCSKGSAAPHEPQRHAQGRSCFIWWQRVQHAQACCHFCCQPHA